jgi:hypothetical protein
VYVHSGTNSVKLRIAGCKVNVHYEPPEDGLVKAETYVGVKE